MNVTDAQTESLSPARTCARARRFSKHIYARRFFRHNAQETFPAWALLPPCSLFLLPYYGYCISFGTQHRTR